MNNKILIVIFCAAALLACKSDPKPAAPAQAGQDPELTALTRQLAIEPDNDSLLFRRAQVYHQLDGFDEALTDVGNALRLDSLQPAYYHLLADIYLDYARPNDSKRAIDVMNAAAQKFPDRARTLLKLSECYLIVQQHNDALATLNKLLERDPQSAEAFFMTGRVALDMRDTTRAINALEKSARFNAENVDAWLFLGRIFSNKNNPAAIRYFDNALRVDSTNLEAREFKAIFHKRRGEFGRAEQVYRDILQRNPDYSNAWFDLGMMALEQDSFAQAHNYFNVAIKTDPLFVNAYYYRGVTAELQDNYDGALADYQQANRMAPNFKEAKDALKRLKK